MNSKELRKSFFNFFKAKDHSIVKSAPMVLKNDPTLMFTNAGMNQFKDYFLGTEKPVNLRVANSQKCLRVSGKHNDLEEVGHDTYHHTMFEMLGNWSFGDYFKNEAIQWAWEFLTSVLNINKDRIYVTVFEGSKEDGLERDNEAAKYWEECLGQNNNRILNGSKKDNFWEMGDTGPCGPCSEIHIDLRSDIEREDKPGHELVNKDHPLVIEVWNLVFIQYNRKKDGSLEQLPDKHVDTGMGFERLCMVVQDKISNYDTDIFQSIISKISEITGFKYGKDYKVDIALRVVADHLRAVAFSIADGQLPSNNKAGYVIRRILRRAIRYGYTNLNQDKPFIFSLVPVLVDTMGYAFPELKAQEEQIKKIIRQEETAFLNTVGKGIKLIDKRISSLKKEEQNMFPGDEAFILYDTYGFPLDLTKLILKEQNIEIDIEGFNREMKKQKERSKSDASKEISDWVILDDSQRTIFTGYSNTNDIIRILRYRKVLVKNKEMYHLVFDKTPFYAEAGGQVGDTGYITDGKEKITIINTVKENNLIVHISKSLPKNPEGEYTAIVDNKKRIATAKNHTATHLLHFALRKVLGRHVEQKGSLVNDEKLRFDFSHFQKLGNDDIRQIEKLVNDMIQDNIPAKVIDDIPMDEAVDKGAIALFGEKYEEKVRVVGFDESLELCGGTHVDSTGQIGLFKIISEGAIAAGIRRIEALTSSNALDYINRKLSDIDNLSKILQDTGNITNSVTKLLNDIDSLNKRIEKLESDTATKIRDDLASKAENINDIRFIIAKPGIDSVDMMKKIAQMIRSSSQKTIIALGVQIGNKAHLLLSITDDIAGTGKINAGEIIRGASKYIKGGGGGQPFMAVAGGSDPAGINDALEYIKSRIEESVT